MNTVALLEDLGHIVVEANSGREALSKLENGQAFDLIITDHAMPHMTGGQLIAEVSTRWPHIPIILATAMPKRRAASLQVFGVSESPFGKPVFEKRFPGSLGHGPWNSDRAPAVDVITRQGAAQ